MKYPVCTVSSIINPGKYCMVSVDKEHVSEVKYIEEKMESSMMFEDTSEFELNPQMCVAVIDSKGKFRRAVIETQIRNNFYQVLLLDYGRVTAVHRSQIKVITNKRFLKVEPLAFIVKLYGLIPTERVIIDGVKKAKVVQNWTQESQEFVRNIFQESSKVVVQNILIQRRIVYGDLFMQSDPSAKFLSLRKLLCKNEFCSFSESYYIRLEKLIVTDYDAELEKKMQFVEKWQRENFADILKHTYELPVPTFTRDSPTDITSLHVSNSKSTRESSNQQENQTSDGNESNSFERCPELRKAGIGRGKFKSMLEQMKNREKYTSDLSDAGSVNSCTFKSLETTSKGRGKLLNQYIELKKMRELGVPQPQPSAFESKIVKNTSEESSEGEKPIEQDNHFTRLEKAMVKQGEYSDFDDSNELTEVSLLLDEEGPPPLVRNSLCNNKPKTSVVQEESKSLEQNGEMSKSKMVEPFFPSEALTLSGSSEAVDSNGSCDKLTWALPKSNSMALSCCWTPYVVFQDSFVEPVNTFRELPIQSSIIKNLEAGGKFNNLSQVQRWAIPAIRKQHNIIVIGSSKTGKTLSYLIPLIDYIQDDFYFDELPQGNGPAVVVVASSSRVCESIFYMCHSLLGDFTRNKINSSKVQIVLAHSGICEKKVWVNLTNGCDILIATPHCLVRLLEMPIVTNFERLSCLVLDEVDIISQNPFRKSVRIILEKAQFSTRERYYQKIFCGEKWTANVESLVKKFVKSHAAVICSYCEAVMYEKLKPSIYLVDHKEKSGFILDRLRDEMGKSKIVVCEKMSEASCLSDFLAEKGVPTVLAHENILAEKLKVLLTVWKSSKEVVLIVTDGVLSELKIREAQTLVHYDLPSKSKTNFFLRYSTLENFLRDKETSCQFRGRNKKTKPQVIILVDDENHYQLPHIMDFVVRLGGKVTPEILQICQNIRRLIEVNKRNSPICRNLLAFGRCRNSTECSQRHAFLKSLDSPGNLPTSGWVNFEIIKAHNASWLSARLTEHVHTNGKTTKLENQRFCLHEELAKFFQIESNRRFVGTPRVGVVCAVLKEEEEKQVFYRATIIEYLKLDKHEQPMEVSVRLMDEGDVLARKTTELFELPEEFSAPPPSAVDVIIAGVQPMDFDVIWNKTADQFTEDLVSRELEENQYWSGKIVLSLNNLLLLQPVKRKQFLPQLNIHVFDLILQDELLKNEIAVVNADHLPSLVKLAVECDLNIPSEEEKANIDLAVVQPQWAFFDLDYVRVRFLAAESTAIVYLQAKKFQKLLEDLEKDCQKAGIESKDRAIKKPQNMAVGMFCLALFEDGKWNRARIESENENQFQVFFVDHGDFMYIPKTDVVPIPQALLLRLPCQAIECSLVGTKTDSSTNVLQTIYSFSNDGVEDLYACVVKKNLEPSVTKGRKYCVNLLNLKGVSLNKSLVDSDLVQAEESEKFHLENFEIEEEEAEEEQDEQEQEQEEEEEEAASSAVGVSYMEEENELQDYFKNLKDDVFEDEDAMEFLREFASKIFPTGTPVKENNGSLKSETVEGNPPVSDVPKFQTLNIEKLLEVHRNRRKKHKKELSLKNIENVLTPQVLWCQNQLEVQMKVLLGSVADYSLECTTTNVSFRCFSGEKFYAVDLKLFGAINPNMTKVTVKPFHVLLVMTKLASCVWPRLHADEGKHRWVSLDVESLTDKDTAFLERIKLAKREIESGLVKVGSKGPEIRPCSDSEFCDEWVEESESEDDED